METAKSKKIILGIIIVAFIIAIAIGATNAYFSASANSNNISGKTYDFSMSLSVTAVDPSSTPIKGDKLIPLSNGDISKAISSGCVDSNNYAVCKIYRLTFQNSMSEAVTLNGTFTPTQNNFNSLYYSVTGIGGAKSDLTVGNAIANTSVTTGLTGITVPTGESTMYLMMYILNDPNNNQPNDQARAFVGELTLISTASNNGQIKAIFTVG